MMNRLRSTSLLVEVAGMDGCGGSKQRDVPEARGNVFTLREEPVVFQLGNICECDMDKEDEGKQTYPNH